MNPFLNTPIDKEHFKVLTEVHAGTGFISWILQFGEKAEVLEPEHIREEITATVQNLSRMYEVNEKRE